jgi:IS5 family transposase
MACLKRLGLGLNLSIKRKRKREFLDKMERVVLWVPLVRVVEPHYPKAENGRPPFGIETMLRIRYLRQWFALSDPVMEKGLHDMLVFGEFAKLCDGVFRLPDGTTILRFCRLPERHDLATDMLRLVNDILQAKGLIMKKSEVMDATLMAAPISTKNAEGERDLEMKQAKKGNQWFVGMKAHIGVEADSGLMHSVQGPAASVNEVTQVGALQHGEEVAAFGDTGCQGVHKRPEAQGPTWHVAMRPGQRRKLNPFIEPEFIAEQIECARANLRAKAEHALRVLKRQFGFTKVRYRGLRKNTAQVITLFALSNLWTARRQSMGTAR